MKFHHFFSAIFFISTTLSAATPIQLFNIQRSKNANEVRYELLHNGDCVMQKEDPVHGYWQELVKGPDVVSEINTFEQMAYGIKDQVIEGNWVNFKMKALPERSFKARTFKNGDLCTGEAVTTISNQEAILKRIYIFSVESMFRPVVKYIDLFGVTSDGKEVKEHMEIK